MFISLLKKTILVLKNSCFINRKFSIVLFIAITFSISIPQNSHAQRKVIRKKATSIGLKTPIDSLLVITQKVDSLYTTNFNITNPSQTIDTTQIIVSNFFSTVSPNHIQQLQRKYLDSFYDACENELLDSALTNAFKYILIDGKEEERVIWKFLIENYGRDGDTQNTAFLFEKFKDVSALRDNAYNKEIEYLSHNYNEVMYPITFGEIAHGYWMSLANNNFKEVPKYILRIDNVAIDSGTTILSSPRTPWNSERSKYYWYYSFGTENYILRKSQKTFCDENEKVLKLRFATEKERGGNTDRSRQQITENRQWQADMHGKINSSDMGVGEQLAAGVVTDVAAGLLDALAISLGAGSKTVEAYYVETKAISPKLMNANITYKRVKATSLGYTTTKEYKPNQKESFVKWEEADSVLFISPKGKPIYPWNLSVNSSLLNEYNMIKKEYNFWKPKYCLPTLAITAVGSYIMACGISKMSDSIKEYEYDKKTSDRHAIQGSLIFSIGLSAIVGSIGFTHDLISLKRQFAYDEINKKNMDKMRKKAGEFSMQPYLNPDEESIGMNINVIF